MPQRRSTLALLSTLALVGCGSSSGDSTLSGGGGTGVGTESAGTSLDSAPGSHDAEGGDETAVSDETGETGDTVKLDVGSGNDSGPPGDVCKVNLGDMDAPPPCDVQAPPDSFEPVVQWSWDGDNGETNVVATPLVANLTDDNGDGDIDLCDVPDVVVVAYAGNPLDVVTGYLHILDGQTGALHVRIEQAVGNRITPAIGDIDGDGEPEIVSAVLEETDAWPYIVGRLVAFEADGSVAWQAEESFPTWCSPALADVDNDGDVEISCKGLWDHQGHLINEALGGVMVDLDGDGDLEIVNGSSHHHDGSLHFEGIEGVGDIAIANLDDDPEPEILFQKHTGSQTIIVEHDGTVKLEQQYVIGSVRPAAIHDVDGDGAPELLLADVSRYSVYEPDLSLGWSMDVSETSGSAGSTAFDFLGDGSAEAIYADEYTLFAWDGVDGAEQMAVPRSSWTYTEYPVVADVDNDASAEIVVVSNRRSPGEKQTAPAVQAIADAKDRWIPARRIWNQHTYHVTNVREDGTIPQFEVPHWTALNTYRTQAQIAGGGQACDPVPEG